MVVVLAVVLYFVKSLRIALSPRSCFSAGPDLPSILDSDKLATSAATHAE
jgi:hypothetical protein